MRMNVASELALELLEILIIHYFEDLPHLVFENASQLDGLITKLN
jgi:hypothetical protein